MPSDYPQDFDDLRNNMEARLLSYEGTPDPDSTFGPGDIGFHAGAHNDLADAINAVEETLGLVPQGEDNDVAARLAALPTTEDVAAVQAVVDTKSSKEELGAEVLGLQTKIPQGPGRRTAFLGDSITVINTEPSTFTYGANHATLLPIVSNQAMVKVGDFGVSNDTVQKAAERVDDVLEAEPETCFILLGTNNANEGNEANFQEAMALYEEAIVLRLLGAGIHVVVATTPPRSGTKEAPETWKKTMRFNAFIHHLADRYGLVLVDYYKVLADPATGEYLAGTSEDGTHPNPKGARLMAAAAKQAIATAYPGSAVRLSLQRYDTLTFAQDPIFLGEFKSNTGKKWPEGWNGGSGAVVTKEAPTAGDGLEVGNWMKITKPAEVAAGANFIRKLSEFGASPGDRIAIAFRFYLEELSGGAYLSIPLLARDEAGATLLTYTPVWDYAQATSGLFYVEMELPEGTYDIRLNLTFSAEGAGAIKVGQFTPIDLTTSHLPSLIQAAAL